MIIPEILYRCSADYLMAYKEGYEQAKLEMSMKLKSMEALTGTTGTIETLPKEER